MTETEYLKLRQAWQVNFVRTLAERMRRYYLERINANLKRKSWNEKGKQD